MMRNIYSDNLTCGPHLVMIIKPETKIRFRYKSEGGSHGGLTGKQEGKGKKTYPTVKLEGYDVKSPVYIRVSLYTEDKKPHVLEFIGQSEEGTPYIKEYLQEDNTATFTNLKFLSKKKDEICRLLMDQKIEKLGNINKCVRARFEKEYSKELKERAKNIVNSVRLCFEAFEEGNPDVSLCEPLFSDLICNQKTASKGELRIHRMSRVSGTWKGGDEVILLCDKIQKENIEIIFYEPGTDCGYLQGWKENAIFTPADVHYQVAITFKTPQYKTNAEKSVFVCLARNEEKSEPLEFTYIADFEGNPSKKRKNYAREEPVLISSPENVYSESSASSSCNETSEILCVSEEQGTEDDVSDLAVLLDVDDLCQEFDIDMEVLNDIFPDFHLPSDDLLYTAENMNASDPERVYNQSLALIDAPIDITEIDGLSSDSHVDRVTSNKFFNNLKGKSMKECKSNKHPQREGRGQIQQKVYSNLMKRDGLGNTYLHVAVYQNKNVTSILQMIHFANADIINLKNYHQETALHIAVQKRNSDVVKILLRDGSNPNIKNAEGNNCYHIACLDNCSDVMHYLLTLVRYEPEINTYNYEGLTPLHIAVMKKSNECYHLLKTHFPDVSILDQKAGRSLLHYAVEFHPPLVAILLEEGEIDVNIQDFEGNTPLHISCATENIEVVKQLLQAGADPFLKNFKQNCNTLEEGNSEDDVNGQTPVEVTTNLYIQKILTQASSSASESKETIEKLSSVLDVDMRWKAVAIYVMDERYLSSLECSPSPAKALLLHIKKEKQSCFIEYLKTLLEITGPSEALEIIKEKF